MTSNLADVGFVHLHVHTSFSLREGALTIARLVKLAAADRMPALAITDTNNLFGALEFSEKIAKEGIQPIVGMRLTVDFADAAAAQGGRQGAAGATRASLVLLAQSEAGYTNLMRIASRAYLNSEPGDGPHVSLDRLAEGAGGLIALSGGPSGPLDRALLGGTPELAAVRLERLVRLFRAKVLYRAAAAWARRGTPHGSEPRRARFCARTTACRHQRAIFRGSRRLRGP